LKFSSKKCKVLCTLSIAKNYLLAETGTEGSIIEPLGAEDVKRTGVENLAAGFNPPTLLTPINSHWLVIVDSRM